MAIKRVGVVGFGLMGSGIAQVSAQAGYDTVIREVAQPLLDKGFGRVDSSLARIVKVTVMLADMSEWAAMNAEYVTFFGHNLPARSAFGCSGPSLLSALLRHCRQRPRPLPCWTAPKSPGAWASHSIWMWSPL